MKPAAVGSLRMEHLSVYFAHEGEPLAAVNNVDLALPPGAVTCLVGESGCGKSLTARAVLRLMPEKSAISGRIFLGDTDILALSEIELRRFRGRRAAMVFQEPMTSLNPVLTVGEQAAEPLRLHFGMTRAQARQETEDLFAEVGIPAPRSRYDDYPHQLSGGMRQRVMIAMALACRPELLLADEPTTALDATVQGQILRLFADQMREWGMTVLFITHDLGIVAQIADVVGVMYAGRLVEDAPAGEFFAAPRHPYSRGLMRSAPGRQSMRLKRLPAIDGVVPALRDIPLGCPFQPRCAEALPRCSEAMPPPFADGSGRTACWRAEPSFSSR
ncbi:dipeptide/oligopeptide/nickel ABC transporter ATP-binding protein [Deltaproteobacteria bacterium]|nr:dipeptide/oligopeptide/nickel ABC transporter ATP-binding protein [Deltaproteobacteria bacterium]